MKDAFIGTFTVYEGCQTPYICLTLKWMYQYMSMSVEPQTLHTTLICCPGESMILGKTPDAEAWPMREAVTVGGPSIKPDARRVLKASKLLSQAFANTDVVVCHIFASV
jgi:hypothetical protein